MVEGDFYENREEESYRKFTFVECHQGRGCLNAWHVRRLDERLLKRRRKRSSCRPS